MEKERGQEIVKLLRGVIKKKTTDKISRREERLAGTGEGDALLPLTETVVGVLFFPNTLDTCVTFPSALRITWTLSVRDIPTTTYPRSHL